MEPTIVQEIRKLLPGQPALHLAPRVPDPVTGLMIIKKDRPKYALNDDGQLIGLNLSGLGLNNATWSSIYALIESSPIQGLNLSNNELTEFRVTANLRQLVQLDLSYNKNLATVTFDQSMDQLQRLRIRESGLRGALVLPQGFSQLYTVELADNQLNTFRVEGQMDQCRWIDLKNNALSEINFTHPARGLNILDLEGNQLTALPDNLLRFSSLDMLYLYGNPLEGISEELIGGERNNAFSDIKAYLEASREKGGELVPLREAKMVLVGNGMAGKTSIRYRLIDEDKAEAARRPLPKAEERTELLEVEKYTLKHLAPSLTGLEEPVDFTLNIWDYGGQGDYREVQQLFCSKKTLYLYVTTPDDVPLQENYVGYSYWLSMVQAYSFDREEKVSSPIIYVVNKIDDEGIEEAFEENPEKVGEYARAKKIFAGLTKQVKISCQTQYRFSSLRKAVRQTLPAISGDIFTVEYPQHWLEVKTQLERYVEENRHYMTWRDYKELCQDKLKPAQASTWIKVLDRIGAIKYFGEDDQLKHIIFLDPDWLRIQIHRVMDGQPIRGGMISEDDLKKIWGEEWTIMEQVAQYFRLCYRQENEWGENEYVFPSRLHATGPKKKPDAVSGDPTHEVRFAFTPFLPAGMVSKLMVELHHQIFKNLKWRNNFIIHDEQFKNFAHLSEVWRDRKIRVRFFGAEPQGLFLEINRKIKEITDWFRDKHMMYQLEVEPRLKIGQKEYTSEELGMGGLQNVACGWFWDQHYQHSPEQSASKSTNTGAKLKKLIPILSELYPEKHQSRRIVDQAEISPGNISFKDAAYDNWYSILVETKKQKKMKALLQIVRIDYPDDEELKELTQEE